MGKRTVEIVSQHSTQVGPVQVNFKIGRIRKVKMCEECGQNPADLPSRICPGCDAYREHTGHF